MADSFHVYLKKQLLTYVEAERKRGVPLEEIEKVLLNAGHEKNIVDEVFKELEKEHAGNKPEKHAGVEGDMISQLKSAFSQFMAKASDKEIKEAKSDLKKTDTNEIVEEVIEEAEVIEEKTMIESIAFFIYLVAVGLIILFSAGASDSQLVSVAIGFAPVIINAFISFLALSLADNVPLYMFIPLAITSAFYVLGKFTNIPAFQSFEIEGLAVVNFILAFLFNITIVYLRFIKPESMKRRVLKPAVTHKSAPPSTEALQPVKPIHHTSPSSRKEIKELKQEFNI